MLLKSVRRRTDAVQRRLGDGDELNRDRHCNGRQPDRNGANGRSPSSQGDEIEQANRGDANGERCVRPLIHRSKGQRSPGECHNRGDD